LGKIILDQKLENDAELSSRWKYRKHTAPKLWQSLTNFLSAKKNFILAYVSLLTYLRIYAYLRFSTNYDSQLTLMQVSILYITMKYIINFMQQLL